MEKNIKLIDINDGTINYREKAQKAALKYIIENFQQPEQLENLQNIRTKIMVQKNIVDDKLKTSMRYHIIGIRNGIKELYQSSNEISTIGESLKFISLKCNEFNKLEPLLKEFKTYANNMNYIKKAISLLNQLFDVPLVITQIRTEITNGNWLKAHKNMRELENIRDTLCYSHMKSTHLLDRHNKNPNDWPLSKYFSELLTLRRNLWDKMFEIIDEVQNITDENQIKLVNTLRIIEREEAVDDFWIMKKSEKKGFMPIQRPLNYKKNALESMKCSIYSKVRRIKENIDSNNKEYINQIFNQFRTIVMNDLKLIKNNASKCFPPHYKIQSFYAKTYHEAFKSEIENILNESNDELKNKYAIPILIWDRDYTSELLFGNTDLSLEIRDSVQSFSPLLSNNHKEELYNCYLATLVNSMDEYSSNAVNIESKDWRSSKNKPDCYNNLYQTMLPTLLSQTVLSNLESAGSFGFEIKFKGLKVFLLSIENLINKYSIAFKNYSEENFNATKILATYQSSELENDILLPHSENGWKYFLEYSMAISNNCNQLCDSIDVICNQIINDAKKSKSIIDVTDKNLILGQDNVSIISNIKTSINELCNFSCLMIVKDFCVSMQEAFSSLFTEEWKKNSECWGESFFSAIEDFSHVINNLNFNNKFIVWKGIDNWLAVQYIQTLYKMRIKVKEKNEKILIGDQMTKDVSKWIEFFKKQRNLENDEDVDCYAASVCVDLYKCRDISFVRFDLAKLFSLYSDFNDEHASILLSIRCDMTKEAIRNKISELESNDNQTYDKKFGIFSEIIIPKADIFSVFK